MTTTTPPNLGTIIPNASWRRLIYAVYVIALIVAGACQVGFAALELAQPQWLTASLAVLAYLGIPVGGLAIANTPTSADQVTNSHV
jgi:hypothetical protein